MTSFETFADAVAFVREHGKVGYQAPMDCTPATLSASVEDDGSIKVTIFVPADRNWPSETYYRFATASEPDGHAERLRRI